jgi:hypothetical protein
MQNRATGRLRETPSSILERLFDAGNGDEWHRSREKSKIAGRTVIHYVPVPVA